MTRQPPVRERISDVALLYPLLPHLARGATNAEIASRVYLTVEGVKSRLQALYAHLGAIDRAHAVAIGYERGLIPSGTVTNGRGDG